MAALIFAKNAADKVLILDVRQALVYPFTSPNWLDLRLGAWLSLTGTTGSDVAPPAESMTYASAGDKVAIGFKDSGTAAVGTAGTVFAGYGNVNLFAGSPPYQVSLNNAGGSVNGWWNNTTTAIINGDIGHNINAGSLLEFPPSANASGYCAFHVVKLTRPTTSSLSFTCRTSTAFYAGYGNYSSTPTVSSTRTLVRTFPDNALAQPPYTPGYATAVTNSVNLPSAPSALYFHWPFYNSRLRIHTIVLEKYV